MRVLVGATIVLGLGLGSVIGMSFISAGDGSHGSKRHDDHVYSHSFGAVVGDDPVSHITCLFEKGHNQQIYSFSLL